MQSPCPDDVLVAIQENDFAYFPWKDQSFTPDNRQGLRIASRCHLLGSAEPFEGADQASSAFDHPAGLQVARDGSPVLQAGHERALQVA